MKKICKICGKEGMVSGALGVCISCIRVRPREALKYAQITHREVRRVFRLPEEAPKSPGGISCNFCAHECQMGEDQTSFCGLRKNKKGKLQTRATLKSALLHAYFDTLPTNCCASWFCPASYDVGKYNLAVFAYGCGFNCLFCQNPSHKEIATAPFMESSEFIRCAQDPKVACICFFGGSIEPQLPFAINASKELLKKKKKVRICWEWNGIGNPELVREAAEISLKSGGNVKFDLKTYDEHLGLALCGVKNKRAYENFERIARKFFKKRKEPVLSATTLLVPGYVDKYEVEKISRFIAKCNPNIPYSLLVFHPDFYMSDLPITPRKQVEECFEVAKKYLKRVNIGNKHLLGYGEY